MQDAPSGERALLLALIYDVLTLLRKADPLTAEYAEALDWWQGPALDWICQWVELDPDRVRACAARQVSGV